MCQLLSAAYLSTPYVENISWVFWPGRRAELTNPSNCRILTPLHGEVADHVLQETGHVNLLGGCRHGQAGRNGLSRWATAAEFPRSAWATPQADFNVVYQLKCIAYW